jgi:hypothetical protein
MVGTDRGHGDEPAVEQFDAVVFGENARLRHSVILLHRKGTLAGGEQGRRLRGRSRGHGNPGGWKTDQLDVVKCADPGPGCTELPSDYMSKITCTAQPSSVSRISMPWKVMALISV